mmetsp:Transcript_9289/g.22810  ORF Transcript_9289/g.22810 Transcript_9289/m.22810 type:complete len:946 (-) Transcript_9289:235-3072(-)
MDGNRQYENQKFSTEAAENTPKDVESKSTSDGVGVVNGDTTDNTTSVEASSASGDVAKEKTDDKISTKSERSNDDNQNFTEEKRNLPLVKNDDQTNLRGDPSPLGANSITADNDGTKSNSTSKKDDKFSRMEKKKATDASAVDENQTVMRQDSKSPESILRERQAVSMEVDSSEINESDRLVEESMKGQSETSNTNLSTTATYSTRGRSTEAAAVEEKPDRIHIRDAFEESPRPKDTPSGVSFLDDAMTEEERRTRTRFIPGVDGMHMLRKHEIKDDLALASTLPAVVSPSGLLQTRASRLGNASGRSNNAMNVDGNEPTLAINDESTTTVELPSSNLTIPSDTFVAPKGVIVGDTDNTIDVKETEPMVQSPSKVESVMSFNPPRPPESVGGKKKHRMIRWERRPEDIEVDMKNYRRTVQRTRQELQKSEAEDERLEMIDAHLRRHFLHHSQLLDDEYNHLQEKLDVEVENLIRESDLVGSRTRSRNLTKVDVVMRDVLTMLTRNEQKDVLMDGQVSDGVSSSEVFAGVGGLNSQAFMDWERSTKLESMSPCISWIEPGQRVTTLYGEGTVISVLPPESPPTTNILTNFRSDHGSKSDFKKGSKISNESSEEKKYEDDNKLKYDALLPFRVKVRLGYGVGTFVASSIVKIETPAHFTDAKLARRWKDMITSALEVGPCIDLQGMVQSTKKVGEGTSSHGEKDSKENLSTEIGVRSKLASNTTKKSNDDFLTVGASLVPTKFGRGNFLYNMKISDIEETLQHVLYNGHGVLGRKSNPGVTHNFRKWEDDEQEYLNLRASALQLKNALNRQRRIRILNERTTTSMNDRYLRAEELVSEMRSDLKSLKRRLQDELNELGITEGTANKILFQFYQGHHEEDQGDALTPKRLRRASSMIGEMLNDINVGNDRRDGDSRDSMDDQGTDDLSGDDLEARRPAKKIRSNNSIE